MKSRTFVLASAMTISCFHVVLAAPPRHFAHDALGGTLSRDHQSRAMFHAGQHRRTYVTYLDHHFNARLTYYDHNTKTWAPYPWRIDTCIEGRYPDGHNVPNLWVSRDGTIHVFYGTHAGDFRYARSTKPESITQWETGMRVGKRATYPYFVERPNGDLLVFYRYGPTGGYHNPFLAVQCSKDNGKTWSEMHKILAFKHCCKLNGNNALYDPIRNRVHLMPWVRLPDKKTVYTFHFEFDPDSKRAYSINGTYLGLLPKDEDFHKHCRLGGANVMDMCLHEGTPYFLIDDSERGICFSRWDGRKLISHQIPRKKISGAYGLSMCPYTADGQTFKIAALRRANDDTGMRGLNLAVWTSVDGGKSWDAGKCWIDRRELGYGLSGLNPVMNYPGKGPFLICAEAKGKQPQRDEITRDNHYDNPGRRDKKLYAIDEAGRFVTNAGSN